MTHESSTAIFIYLYWRYVYIAPVIVLWRSALSPSVVVVVVGVCNRCQMITSKCTCVIFGVTIGS